MYQSIEQRKPFEQGEDEHYYNGDEALNVSLQRQNTLHSKTLFVFALVLICLCSIGLAVVSASADDKEINSRLNPTLSAYSYTNADSLTKAERVALGLEEPHVRKSEKFTQSISPDPNQFPKENVYSGTTSSDVTMDVSDPNQLSHIERIKAGLEPSMTYADRIVAGVEEYHPPKKSLGAEDIVLPASDFQDAVAYNRPADQSKQIPLPTFSGDASEENNLSHAGRIQAGLEPETTYADRIVSGMEEYHPPKQAVNDVEIDQAAEHIQHSASVETAVQDMNNMQPMSNSAAVGLQTSKNTNQLTKADRVALGLEEEHPKKEEKFIQVSPSVAGKQRTTVMNFAHDDSKSLAAPDRSNVKVVSRPIPEDKLEQLMQV
mmetsp:Transcript_25385/g.33144  ORF Transcript_25385/g.33144 Transcript_25385/m.33144 type:complete len:376 (-) Transcript_25385:193-1320(-)